MEQNYVALQGKTLEVDLQSMYGSSAYGWFLSALPEELVLLSADIVPVRPGIAPVIHKFYFGVISAETANVEIKFVLAAAYDLTKVADTFTAKVRIMPCDAADFQPAGEIANAGTPFFPARNASVNRMADMSNCQQPYGYPGPYANSPFLSASGEMSNAYGVSDIANDTRPYGYPDMCVDTPFFPTKKKKKKAKKAQEAALKYGYACSAQEAALKYGYPCAAQEAALKYGYPCGAQEAVLKYGYPCGVQDAALKYGYPCGVQSAAAACDGVCNTRDADLNYSCLTQSACAGDGRLYGYPLVAYGYPLTKYGYPCC